MGFLLDFLFGKSAKIFNKKGRVEHNHGSKKWEEWNNRLEKNPDYNWREHKGKASESVKKEKAH